MPYLAGIWIYPIKSLDGIAISQATVLKSGALEHDREFAMVDDRFMFVNGKRNSKVHLLRSTFDAECKTVTLKIPGNEQHYRFSLDGDRTFLETWLSDYFGFPIQLKQNSFAGFPDDTNASGPTVISTETIEAIAAWFQGIPVDEMRLRLRANLELGDVPPFWEDRLFTEEGQIIEFQIGDVLFQGINPCQRCVVPTRNPFTAESYPKFQTIFINQRKKNLPSWTTPSRFNHFYRLSINTRIPPSEEGKVLRVGDEVKL